MGVVFLLAPYIESDRADPASKCAAQHRGPTFEQQVPAPQQQTPCQADFSLDYKPGPLPVKVRTSLFPRLRSLLSGPLLCLAGAG